MSKLSTKHLITSLIIIIILGSLLLINNLFPDIFGKESNTTKIKNLNEKQTDKILSELGASGDKINSLSLEGKQNRLIEIKESVENFSKEDISTNTYTGEEFQEDKEYSQEINEFHSQKEKIVNKIGNKCEGTISFSDIGKCIGNNSIDKKKVLDDIPQKYKNRFLKNYYIGIFEEDLNSLFSEYKNDAALTAKKEVIDSLYQKNLLQNQSCQQIPEKTIENHCENLF